MNASELVHMDVKKLGDLAAFLGRAIGKVERLNRTLLTEWAY